MSTIEALNLAPIAEQRNNHIRTDYQQQWIHTSVQVFYDSGIGEILEWSFGNVVEVVQVPDEVCLIGKITIPCAATGYGNRQDLSLQQVGVPRDEVTGFGNQCLTDTKEIRYVSKVHELWRQSKVI